MNSSRSLLCADRQVRLGGAGVWGRPLPRRWAAGLARQLGLLLRLVLLWAAGVLLASAWAAGSAREGGALAPPAAAPEQPMQAGVVPVRGPGGLALQGQVAVLADPTGLLTLDEVRAASAAARWSTPNQPLRAGGPTVWWQRLVLQPQQAHGRWLLALPSTALRDVTLFGPFAADGTALAPPQASGLIRPFASRPLGLERLTFVLDLPQAGTYTVYLRVQSSIDQHMTPTLWHESDLHLARQHQRLFDGVVYGALVAFLFAALALWLSFREPPFAWFGAMSGAALLTLLSFNGHAAQYLWPNSPWWIEHSYVSFPALWLVASAGFARAFLNTRQTAPPFDAVLLLLAVLALGSLCLGLAGWSVGAHQANELIALFGSLVLALIAAQLWRRGFTPARWYLLGSLAPFASVVAVLLVNWGGSDWLFLQHNSLELGLLVQSLVLSGALSARIRHVQRENALLARRADRLALAATTDSLTGLTNRRGLIEISQSLLRRPGQHAVVLLDLDRFKPINDQLGHEAGDFVLAEVGRRLQRHSRTRDVVARLGGDEFVLLIGQCPARPELDAMLERLRLLLDAPIHYREHPLQVSASIGVALCPDDGMDLHNLLRAADWAMYGAKQQRNGVRFAADAPRIEPPTGLMQMP